MREPVFRPFRASPAACSGSYGAEFGGWATASWPGQADKPGHFGRIDGVSAPAPSCGGGPGWGVALTGEMIECAGARLSPKDGATLLGPPPQGDAAGRFPRKPKAARLRAQRPAIGAGADQHFKAMDSRLLCS